MPLQIGNLGFVPAHYIALARVLLHEILVIGLGRIKGFIGLDLGHNRPFPIFAFAKLRQIGAGGFGPGHYLSE